MSALDLSILRSLGSNTELLDPIGIDFTECRCALHRKVLHSVKGGKGCASRALGRFPPIWGANAGVQTHGFCHATAFQREADAELIIQCRQLMNDGGRSLAEIRAQQAKYAGPSHAASEFGAGYCYMEAIEGVHRARAARALGDYPLVQDVLLVTAILGRWDMKLLDVVEVDVGKHHVVKRPGAKGMTAGALLGYLRELVQVVVSSGGVARVGSTLDGWLESVGVGLSSGLVRDTKLFECEIHAMSYLGRLRFDQLVGVGNDFMRLQLRLALVCTGLVDRVDGIVDTRCQDDHLEALFAASSASPCAPGRFSLDWIPVDAADKVRAVVGLVFIHHGFGEAVGVLKAFRFLGDSWSSGALGV